MAVVLMGMVPAAIAGDHAPEFNQRLMRGLAELHSGSYKQAISDFKAANKLKHKQCDVCLLGLAAAYLHLQQFDDSQESCRKAIACSSDAHVKAEAYSVWGDVSLRSAGDDAKKLEVAVKQYRRSVELDPQYASAHWNLGVALLKTSHDDEGRQELQRFLQLSPSGPNAELARKLIANPDRARFDYAPDFHAVTAAGQEISLEQFAGKVVVLDFWATWCPPCRSSVPELKDLTRKYSTDKLQVISISADSDEKQWRGFIAKKNMEWPQIRDSDHAIGDKFGITGFPTYLVIDRRGIIRERIVGLNPQQSIVARLRSELVKMLE